MTIQTRKKYSSHKLIIYCKVFCMFFFHAKQMFRLFAGIFAVKASVASYSSISQRSLFDQRVFQSTHWGGNGIADSKYVPSKFPDDTPGAFFSGVFSHNVVLQRAPAAANMYGVVIGTTDNATTKVTVIVTDESGKVADATYDAQVNVIPGKMTKFGGYARWITALKPLPAGGNFTISASCTGCASANASSIGNVTFGDVFFCSGQSNMWLPMHMDTSRNQTFDAVLAGKYSNIRMHSVPHNNQPDGGYNGTDLFISPPAPPRNPWGGDAGGGWLLPNVGTYANKTCRDGGGDHGCREPSHCCTGYPQPNDDWLFNSIDQFSASCWHYAQHLTDLMEKNSEPVIPLGLISSQWGGTMIQHWIPNATINSGKCKNASDMEYLPVQNGRWDIDNGALWNGMVTPWINFIIKGALWYQGENNVFQCHDANSTSPSTRGPGGGPNACGNIEMNTGYACFMKMLIDTWRKSWTYDFPIGIVSLAGGTSEGYGNNMGAFRLAQSGNTGLLPNALMQNTFTAMSYDLGDPCSGGGQCCENDADGQGGWACKSGVAPYTAQFMGSIHPRVKRKVGERLAKAARAFIYNDTDVIWTGPLLTGCVLDNSGITLTFDSDKLKSDTISVMSPTSHAISLVDAEGHAWNPSLFSLLQKLGSSPMEIQMNGGTSKEMTDGIWLPAPLQSKCARRGSDNVPAGQGACSLNVTTGKRVDGWNTVRVQLPPSIIANVTGVRYAWGDNPCCPTFNRQVAPCPPEACPISTFNTSLPAVPFWANIQDGKCTYMTTQGGGI